MTRKIYLELWLVLWDNVVLNLKSNSNEIYKTNEDWLVNQLDVLHSTKILSWELTRLTTLIDKSLDLMKSINPNIKSVDGNSQSKPEIIVSDVNNCLVPPDNTSIFNLQTTEFKQLFTKEENGYKLGDESVYKSDYILLKNKYTEILLNKYILKYLLETCVSKTNENSGKFQTTINIIITYLIDKDKLLKLIDTLIEDDDIICDYPIFKKNIKLYID